MSRGPQVTSGRSRASAPPGRTPAPAQGQRGSGMGEKRVGPSTYQYKPVCPSTSQGPPQHIPVPPQYIPVHPSNLPVCPSAPQVHLNTSQCPPSPSQPIPVYPSAHPRQRQGPEALGEGAGPALAQAGTGQAVGTLRGHHRGGYWGILGGTGRDLDELGGTGRGLGTSWGRSPGRRSPRCQRQVPFLGEKGR